MAEWNVVIAGDSILIVDDSEEIRVPLLMMLELEGFTAVGVESGGEGLDVLRSSKTFSLILLDIKMPDMSGLAFLERKQREHLGDGTPVIIFSGSALDGMKFPDDVVGQIRKPIAFPDLIESLKQLHLH